MSVSLMARVWSADISPRPKLLLIAMCDESGDGIYYPDMEHLTQKCSLTRESIEIILRNLERQGYVKKDGLGTYHLFPDETSKV